jgi:hypothetical protein
MTQPKPTSTVSNKASVTSSMVVSYAVLPAGSGVKSWNCSGYGHMQQSCPSASSQMVLVSRGQENTLGTQQ